MTNTRAYAAYDPTTPLAPIRIAQRDLGPDDVEIQILFCGVCHSDLHQARNEWGGSIYPMVPGHEIVGRVTRVGPAVTRLAVGALAGVGCLVDSCRACESCRAGEEQYCEKGATPTYNGRRADGTPTYGGYAERIIVSEAFTLTLSPTLDLAAVAPLLCAGITTWSPLKHWKVGPGQRVGIVGLGGLGHMGLKFARAFGAHVTQFTTSRGKEDDARRLGADEVVVTRDPASSTGSRPASSTGSRPELKALRGTFDFILDTVSAPHELAPFLSLLRRNGTMVLVGIPEKPAQLATGVLAFKRRSLAGSAIGGIAETQEMLDYCATHQIVADIERIPIQGINDAYRRMLLNDVKYRFVIDMASLASE